MNSVRDDYPNFHAGSAVVKIMGIKDTFVDLGCSFYSRRALNVTQKGFSVI